MKRLIWNKHTKRLLRHVAGWFCIVAGVIMLVTPGQGLLTLLIGVYLLADEIPLFARIKAWLEQRFPKTAAFVHEKGAQLHARLHRKKPSGS